MISWWEVFCHTRSMEIKAIPKRTRFYHAKIDSANLASGEDYSCLRNVVVIFITTYDPFGLDRMVYTVKNRCVEEPDMPYEDGVRTLYLYTRGTKGSPTEELKSLLCYMEKSTEENAYTTVSQLTEEGYDEETAAAAIDMLNI